MTASVSCAATALCAIALTGCTVGADYVKPENRLGEVALTARADPAGAPQTFDADVPAQWWTLFNDGMLTELQSRAQINNLDLQTASERIEQSRAQLGIVSSRLLPTVASGAS